jgi:hypothetical protein
VDGGIVGGEANWVKAMSTNSKSYMSLDGRPDRQRGSWAEVMSTNSQSVMSLGGKMDRRGEIDEKRLNSH